MITGLSMSLSTTQCDYLIEHIDRVRPITTENRNENATRAALVARGLLRYEPTAASFPAGTVLTEKGRETVCAILAHYADALVSAGLIKQRPIIDIPKFRRGQQALEAVT